METPKFVVLRGFHTSRNESLSRGTRSPNLVLRGFHNLRLISLAALCQVSWCLWTFAWPRHAVKFSFRIKQKVCSVGKTTAKHERGNGHSIGTFVGLFVIAFAVILSPFPLSIPSPTTLGPNIPRPLSQLKTIGGGLPPSEHGGKTYDLRAAAPTFFVFVLIATSPWPAKISHLASHPHNTLTCNHTSLSHPHQEITRVILCRWILNDIMIHIKF